MLEPIAARTLNWVADAGLPCTPIFSTKEGNRPIKNSATIIRLFYPNDKEIHTVPNNRHQQLRSLQNMARDLYGHVIIRNLTNIFTNQSLCTGISNLSRVALVQHPYARYNILLMCYPIRCCVRNRFFYLLSLITFIDCMACWHHVLRCASSNTYITRKIFTRGIMNM